MCEDANHRLLVSTVAFERLAEGVGVGFHSGVALSHLTRDVASGWWSRYCLRYTV